MSEGMTGEIPVRLVRMHLCDLCLDGAGGECHSPGCALWINRAPDLPLRESPFVTILAAPDAAIGIRERLENLAARLELSAASTAPSRKSDIEQQCAIAIREILRTTPGAAGSARDALDAQTLHDSPGSDL